MAWGVLEKVDFIVAELLNGFECLLCFRHVFLINREHFHSPFSFVYIIAKHLWLGLIQFTKLNSVKRFLFVLTLIQKCLELLLKNTNFVGKWLLLGLLEKYCS